MPSAPKIAAMSHIHTSTFLSRSALLISSVVNFSRLLCAINFIASFNKHQLIL
jgi:hypothetical protein